MDIYYRIGSDCLRDTSAHSRDGFARYRDIFACLRDDFAHQSDVFPRHRDNFLQKTKNSTNRIMKNDYICYRTEPKGFAPNMVLLTTPAAGATLTFAVLKFNLTI